MSSTVIATYLSEVFPTKHRGTIVVGQFIIYVFGEVYICLFALYLSPNLDPQYWRQLVILAVLPYVVPLLFMIYLPRCPLFLASQGKKIEAIQAYDIIFRANN